MTTPTHNRESDTVVVIPCYNESQRLNREAVHRAVELQSGVRFLFVDDGSTDDTAAVLETLCANSPHRLHWIAMPSNSGKAEAVRTGVKQAIAEGARLVGYWDADLATPLTAIPSFVEALNGDESRIGVLGSRVRRLGAHVERRPLRHYAGRLFATAASLVLGIAVYDTQCGAKLFRVSKEVESAFAEPFLSRWVFDVEVLARLRGAYSAQALTDRLLELPLSDWSDVAGSKLTTATGAAAFWELVQIYRKYR